DVIAEAADAAQQRIVLNAAAPVARSGGGRSGHSHYSRSQTVLDAGLRVKLVDMRFDLWLDAIVRRRMRPADLVARMQSDLLVLLRGSTADAVGADHLVALEHRGRAAAGGDAPIGHGGEAHEQLRIALLEPLLDEQAIGKARAHRA